MQFTFSLIERQFSLVIGGVEVKWGNARPVGIEVWVGMHIFRPMKIEGIRLKNFKVFKELNLENLSALAIFVGANGSGKSTLFDVFGFLKDALQNNVRQALAKRGGFQEVRSRNCEGPIEIELKVRMQIGKKSRLVTYLIQVEEKDGRPFISREVLAYKRGQYGSPFRFLDFTNGEGFAIENEGDFDKPDTELSKEFQVLDSSDIPAIKGLGQFQKFFAANAFRKLIENWHVSDFHISEARPSQEAGYAEHLSVSGDNLPLVTQYVYEHHPEIFEKILDRMKERVPGVSKVVADTTVDGRVVLKFQDGSFKDPFLAKFVSDGTLKMFAYLVLMYDPKPHPLLSIEEPENQLYPSLLPELVEEFRTYAQKGQVFVSTHSPDLLNAAEIEEVFWLVKKDGFTEVRRASADPLIRELVAAGDQLGYLWNQGYLKGSHP